jgi:hypothetical protein
VVKGELVDFYHLSMCDHHSSIRDGKVQLFPYNLRCCGFGLVWFGFHVFQFLPIKCKQQQNSCCINKSTMRHLQKLDENWTSLDLVMVIRSAWLLIA